MRHRIVKAIGTALIVAAFSSVFASTALAYGGPEANQPPPSSGPTRGSYAPSHSDSAAPDQSSTWPCTVVVIAWAVNSTTMGAYSYTDCNGGFAETTVTIEAYHCLLSIGSTCFIWSDQGLMDACDATFTYYVW